MELCDYGDLNSFHKQVELTMYQRLEIMVQIASGISYLHQNRVVHQDIKPENIIVSPSFFEEIFVTSAISTNVGTLACKAPEFFQRTKDGKLLYHRNVDVYAAGLTFFGINSRNRDKETTHTEIRNFSR